MFLGSKETFLWCLCQRKNAHFKSLTNPRSLDLYNPLIRVDAMVNSLGYLNWTLFKIGDLCWYMVTEGTQSYILVYRKVDVFDKVEKIPSKDFASAIETGEQKMSLHLKVL